MAGDINTLNKFDVIKFAKNIISEVEALRSFKTATDEVTTQRFNVPTESRLNTFLD